MPIDKLHDAVFTWVLQRLAERGLVKGERIGVDASTMEANAALRAIVRRGSGEGYREMLTCMARESAIETPTAEDLIRLDRSRKGKKLSNTDRESPTDPDARIARLEDGRTRLAHKPEHAVDLDTGTVVAAKVHAADRGDTATLPDTLASAARHLGAVEAAPSPVAPAELVVGKGYHSRETLKALDDGAWKTRIGQVARLHQAEAARTIRGGTSMTSREVGAAWDSANVLLAEAAAELDRVQATMIAQIRAVVETVSEAEDAATGRRR